MSKIEQFNSKNYQDDLENPSPRIDNNNTQAIATGLGVAGGGIAGAAIGKSLGGKVGETVGGIAGAIAGGIAGNQLVELAQEVTKELSPSYSLGLGANNKPIELPRHYSWEELQALSKPQLPNS